MKISPPKNKTPSNRTPRGMKHDPVMADHDYSHGFRDLIGGARAGQD
ncbi:MAG TPA: hypothetical protein VHX99_08715 [Rhizomicrobium sp.]|jgi:hypothetical protein|nr:hypothetical protein [Rhizomicrobium sp.]